VASDRAQFAIDVSASMPAGEATIAQLDALSAELMGSGKNADFFSAAIQRVSTQVEAAGRASQAAGAALADGRAEYGALERAAVNAAKAAERSALKNGYASAETANLAEKAHSAAAAVSTYATTLDRLEREAAGAGAEHARLGAQMRNLGKLNSHVNATLARNAESLSKLRGVMGGVGGAAGQLGARVLQPIHGFTELTGSIGASNAASVLAITGFAALAVGVALLGVAAIGAVVAFTGLGIKLADTARSAGLAAEAFDAANPSLSALRPVVRELSAETGLGSSSLEKLAKSLEGANVAAEHLPATLRAAALAERALGQGGAEQYIAQLKEGKLSAREFARSAEQSFGGIVARQMLSLEAQGDRLKSNFAGLFGGLNIEPLLGGISKLVALFDKSSSSGRALQAIFETVLQPLIDKAAVAAEVVEAFVLGILIGGVKIYLALKPIIAAVSELFGFEDTSLTDTLSAAKAVGEFLAPVIIGLTAVFGVLTAVLAIGAAAILAIPAAFMLIPQAVNAVAKSIVDFFGAVNLKDVGLAMITGLVQGIIGGGGAVVSAVTGVANGAIMAAKRALGIASPSRVFAGLGEFTSEGFAQGVDAEAPAAQAAMTNMVAPPAALGAMSPAAPAAASAPNAAPAPGGGAPQVHIHGPLSFSGLADAKEGVTHFAEWLLETLESDALAARGGAT
jgi:hypothetical protein